MRKDMDKMKDDNRSLFYELEAKRYAVLTTLVLFLSSLRSQGNLGQHEGPCLGCCSQQRSQQPNTAASAITIRISKGESQRTSGGCSFLAARRLEHSLRAVEVGPQGAARHCRAQVRVSL